MKYKKLSSLCIYITAIAMATGCANSTNKNLNQDQDQVSSTNEDPCSMGQSVFAGAVTGLLIGAIANGKKGAGKGALLGGAAGAIACVAINFQSRQTKTSNQVDSEYKNARGQLPAQPKITSYSPKLDSKITQRGQPIKVSSKLEVVNGYSEPVNSIREELLLFNPDSSPFKTGNKPFTANSGGKYENTFDIMLPQGAAQGKYSMITNVYINDKLSATRNLQTQIVLNEDSLWLVASSTPE